MELEFKRIACATPDSCCYHAECSCCRATLPGGVEVTRTGYGSVRVTAPVGDGRGAAVAVALVAFGIVNVLIVGEYDSRTGSQSYSGWHESTLASVGCVDGTTTLVSWGEGCGMLYTSHGPDPLPGEVGDAAIVVAAPPPPRALPGYRWTVRGRDAPQMFSMCTPVPASVASRARVIGAIVREHVKSYPPMLPALPAPDPAVVAAFATELRALSGRETWHARLAEMAGNHGELAAVDAVLASGEYGTLDPRGHARALVRQAVYCAKARAASAGGVS